MNIKTEALKRSRHRNRLNIMLLNVILWACMLCLSAMVDAGVAQVSVPTNSTEHGSGSKSKLVGVVVIHRHAVRTPRVLAPGGNAIHSAGARLVPEGEKQMRQLGDYLWRRYFSSSNTTSIVEGTNQTAANGTALNYFSAYSAKSQRCIDSSRLLWEGFHNATLGDASLKLLTLPKAIVKESGPDYLYQINTWENVALHFANPAVARYFHLDAFTDMRGSSDIADLLREHLTDIARETRCGDKYDEYLCLLVAYDVADIVRTRGYCEDPSDATLDTNRYDGSAKSDHTQEDENINESLHADNKTSSLDHSTQPNVKEEAMNSGRYPTLCSQDVYMALRELTAYQNYHFYAFLDPEDFQKMYVGSFTRPLYDDIMEKVKHATLQRSVDPVERQGKFMIEYSVHDGTLVGLYAMLGLLRQQNMDRSHFQSSSYELPAFGEALLLEIHENDELVAFRVQPGSKGGNYTYHTPKQHLPLKCVGKTRPDNHKLINVTVTRSSNMTYHCCRSGLTRYVHHHWTPTKLINNHTNPGAQSCAVDPDDVLAMHCGPEMTDPPVSGSVCAYFRSHCPSTACPSPQYQLDRGTLLCITITKPLQTPVSKMAMKASSEKEKKHKVHDKKDKNDTLPTRISELVAYESKNMHRVVVIVLLVAVSISMVCAMCYMLRFKRKAANTLNEVHGPGSPATLVGASVPKYSTF